MCDFLGRMVLLKKTAPIKFLCWCLLWFAKRRDLVAFLRCKHTHRNGGVRDVHVLICTRVVQIGVAVPGTLALDLRNLISDVWSFSGSLCDHIICTPSIYLGWGIRKDTGVLLVSLGRKNGIMWRQQSIANIGVPGIPLRGTCTST